MVEDGDAVKTENASSRSPEKTREDSDVPGAREIATAVLMTAGDGSCVNGGSLFDALASGLSLDREQIYNPAILLERTGGVMLVNTLRIWIRSGAGNLLRTVQQRPSPRYCIMRTLVASP